MTTSSFNSHEPKSADSRIDSRAHIVSRPVLLLLIILSVSAVESRAQLPYDHTTFLPGLGSGSSIWKTSYADIGATPPSYLSQRIDLKNIGYADLDSTARYDGQIGNLASYLTPGGQHVLVGHSLGSLVARGTYIDNPGLRAEIAAIIAVSAPHQGAPIADNFVLLRSYLRDMQRRIEDAQAVANLEALVLEMIFIRYMPTNIKGLGPALMAFALYIINGNQIDFTNVDQFGAAPALTDLSPSTGTIAHLNGRFDDGAIPRANIYATIPFRNAALRLYKSAVNDDPGFPALVRTRDRAQMLFSSCKWVGYVIVPMWTAGRRCAYARKTLGRLDERWARYMNGWDQNGNTRYVPFDGVVPNERSNYPSTNGLAFEKRVDLIDHLNVYKTRIGLDQVVEAMSAINMRRVSGAPPPPTPVNIYGPSQIEVGCSGAWATSLNWGVGPYSYRWTVGGTPYDTGPDNQLFFTPSSVGSLYITATATDSNGSSGTGSMTVTVTTGNCT